MNEPDYEMFWLQNRICAAIERAEFAITKTSEAVVDLKVARELLKHYAAAERNKQEGTQA